jgi:hypothetical protein
MAMKWIYAVLPAKPDSFIPETTYSICPKEHWEQNRCEYDGEEMDETLDELGFCRLMESCYDYEGLQVDAELALKGLGFEHSLEFEEWLKTLIQGGW